MFGRGSRGEELAEVKGGRGMMGGGWLAILAVCGVSGRGGRG